MLVFVINAEETPEPPPPRDFVYFDSLFCPYPLSCIFRTCPDICQDHFETVLITLEASLIEQGMRHICIFSPNVPAHAMVCSKWKYGS